METFEKKSKFSLDEIKYIVSYRGWYVCDLYDPLDAFITYFKNINLSI